VLYTGAVGLKHGSALIHAGFIGGVVTLPAFKSDFHLNTKSAAAQTAFSSNVVSVFQVSDLCLDLSACLC
jgi:hypothetical protein